MKELVERLVSGLSDCRDHVAAYAEAAINDLNHRILICLYRRSSCSCSKSRTVYAKNFFIVFSATVRC